MASSMSLAQNLRGATTKAIFVIPFIQTENGAELTRTAEPANVATREEERQALEQGPLLR